MRMITEATQIIDMISIEQKINNRRSIISFQYDQKYSFVTKHKRYSHACAIETKCFT